MYKKVLIALIAAFLWNSALFAQEVKRGGGVVSVDGKPILTYEITKVPGNKIYSYYALGEEEELFQAHFCSNWSYYNTDDYRHYYFPASQLELILPRRRKYRFEVLLPKMLNSGVLDRKGNLDENALRNFVMQNHVPLPKSFGPKVHQLPVISGDEENLHRWKFSPDYDQVEKKWKQTEPDKP